MRNLGYEHFLFPEITEQEEQAKTCEEYLLRGWGARVVISLTVFCLNFTLKIFFFLLKSKFRLKK